MGLFIALNHTRSPQPCTTKRVQHNHGVFPLHRSNYPEIGNQDMLSHKRLHEGVGADCISPIRWISTATQQQIKYEKVKHMIEAQSSTAATDKAAV